MSEQLLPVLQRNRPLWQGLPARFQDRRSLHPRALRAQRNGARLRLVAAEGWLYTVSYNKWTGPLERAVPALLGLRLRTGGSRRRTDVGKGRKGVRRRVESGRTRTIKALTRVYELKGLPAMSVVKPAENRVLVEMGVSEFVAGWAEGRIVASPGN